jgi:hypothetical protein
MRNDDRLPICESSDFHYLLTLLPALKDLPEYRWLPELFSTLGYEKLVELCRYAGGETITLPTLQTLSNSIDALELFYNVYLTGKQSETEIPTELLPDVLKIRKIFNAQNRAKFGDEKEV